ncbi:mitochondrial protein [Cryptococcus wingfieldii CBS 7118]|uniref:Mitochondrial protein n=1 Tax=Cryptococcus wingfieldii CBS 7118 TaxID=1295528 RepID=A0A1E3ILZ2_9TREE|nr:mitochondrial protein [Cryptococcus wingfieldii CBS 7118]ODN89617.1 mitochondrial protein [Cryptococcus wingfieldii CBS 7118]
MARLAHLPHKHVLELAGPDAHKFLKGLTSKDVEYLAGGYSGFLNASGRVLHPVFIFPRSPNSYLIAHESPPHHPAPLPALLPPFKLRSKVRIKDVSEQWDAWSAWQDTVPEGPSPLRTWKMGSGGAAESRWDWQDGIRTVGLSEQEVGCWDLRAGWNSMGRQILVPKGQSPSLSSSHDIASLDDYKLHRMLLGVPEGQDEIIPGSALPLESSMDIHGGVDFRKGCYLGQELTVRTYHTGATRKRILPVRLFPMDHSGSILDLISSPSPASSLEATFPLDITFHPPTSSASKKPRSAGKILSLHNTVGLALVRLEMAERTWWSSDNLATSASQWAQGETGRLTTQINGKEYGLYVGQGEAYASALANTPSSGLETSN